MKNSIKLSVLLFLLSFSLFSFKTKGGIHGLFLEIRTLSSAEAQFMAGNSNQWIELKIESDNADLKFKLIDKKGAVIKSGSLRECKTRIDISEIMYGHYQMIVSDGINTTSQKIALL